MFVLLSYFPVISSVQKDKSQTLLFVSFIVAVVVKIRAIYWASIAGQNFFVIIQISGILYLCYCSWKTYWNLHWKQKL